MSDDLVERQKAEIDMLRERVRQLESLIVPEDVTIPIEWQLTARESKLFAALTTREVATKDYIMAAVYEPGVDDEPEPKIVDVFICKIRRKVQPFGVNIETVWGRGYTLHNRENYRRAA